MVSTPQIEVGAQLASIHTTISSGEGPASTAQYDGRAIASTAVVLPMGDRPDRPLQLLRTTSAWESALIAVLFLLISGLVGLRLAELLSTRDVELSSLPLVTTADDDGKASREHTDDHRAYESYLSPETPPTLLSDEGKVVRLLVANHGRIRQHRIAEETGWSKSKVSRICSQMHSDGTIEKQSVGRENVITLADRTPADEAQSDEIGNPLP
ncbi:helix-turn-helix transcriptional regulator [Natrinema marinum]|uniref:helix-turn-helix transcriptional regulator n=1 Tax=Natrinema marinum TaxID=2961598 RepID=UPI0020C85C6D|nr:helix-turn-helix domain-containing protein [Natrinema marinum]